MLTKEPETLHLNAFGEHTMQQNMQLQGTPLGELTALCAPQIPYSFKEAASRRRAKGKGGDDKGMGQVGRGMGGKGSWNRAVYGLRPALN